MKKRVAFVGNPNVGKSAIINLLAESDLKVGNWSGVTTERIEATYTYRHQDFECIDLPGLYGMNHQTDEERITEAFMEDERIDCLVNVLDSSCLMNNLYCTLQCREKQIPMIMVLNFDDERMKNGIVIDAQRISNRLGIPIIQLSAFDKKQAVPLKELIFRQASATVNYHPLFERGMDQLFCDFCNQYHFDLKEGLRQFEKRYPEEVLKMRFEAVQSFENYISKTEPKTLIRSRKIDAWALHPILAYPIVILTFILLCTIVFEGSKPLVAMIEWLMQGIENFAQLGLSQTPELVQKLVLEGFLGSLTTILSFIPLLGLLYCMIAILEESGYMARIALLADHLMRIFHLSGKSMISLILGFGCNVPAIASCGALENEKMRKKVALLVPFMSCGARLPIYFFFINAFFPEYPALVLFILYGTGILIACLLSLVLDIKCKDDYYHPQMIELPAYRWPKWQVVLSKVKRECIAFLQKTFKIVLWVLLILWTLMNLPSNNPETSYLAQIAKSVSFLFVPLGFGVHWQLVASLFPAFVAKESVVAFLLMLSPDLAFISGDGRLIALSFMLYCLCSVPCVMTCSILAQKYGWKHALLSIGLMLIIPYLLSFSVYQLFSLF